MARAISADLLQSGSRSHESSSLAECLRGCPCYRGTIFHAHRLYLHKSCIPPADRTGDDIPNRRHQLRHEQVQAVKQATTILSEHGTVSYVALFARDGLPLVVVGKPPMKEAHVPAAEACHHLTCAPQVLLQMTHVYTVYVDIAEGQEGIKAALLVALKVGRPT